MLQNEKVASSGTAQSKLDANSQAAQKVPSTERSNFRLEKDKALPITNVNRSSQKEKMNLGVMLLQEVSSTVATAKKPTAAKLASSVVHRAGNDCRLLNAAKKPESKSSRVITLTEKYTTDTPRSFNVDDVEFIKKLGSGAFSQVFLIQTKSSSHRFALKVLKKDKLTESAGGVRALQERELLAKLKHPSLVHYYGSLNDPFYQYLVLEYINGRDLCRYLRKIGAFEETTVRFFCAEIIVALEYLHANGVLYRDLKPENIIAEPSGHLRLVDFGLSIAICDGKTKTFCGTAEYIAPEMLRSEPYNLSLDYYGLGILTFEMLVGRTPFYDNNRSVLYEKILAGYIDWDHISHKMSPGAQNFVKQLVQLRPAERLGYDGGFKAIKADPWFEPLCAEWDKFATRSLPSPFNPSSIIPIEPAVQSRSCPNVKPVTEQLGLLGLRAGEEKVEVSAVVGPMSKGEIQVVPTDSSQATVCS